MQLTLQAKGKQADNISHVIGKHPDNPFSKKKNDGWMELKFLKYEPEEVEFYFTYRPHGLSMLKKHNYHNLEDYINDREFSVSSIFLKSAKETIGDVLKKNHEGTDIPYEFTVEISPIATRLPEEVVRELFEPLGYTVDIEKIESEYDFSLDSGQAISLKISQTIDIQNLFKHLFVLIPVMDNYKHYSIDSDEVEKLLKLGEGWLANHPSAFFISKRFMKYRRNFLKKVMSTLEEKKKEEQENDSAEEIEQAQEVEVKKEGLGVVRYRSFAEEIVSLGIQEVVDMGAGEGRLLDLLAKESSISNIYACEPTKDGRERMYKLLDFLRDIGKVKVKDIKVLSSSLLYHDERLKHKESIVLCEVIEHINEDRIDSVMESLLGYYNPTYLLLSTPNREYNAVYDMGEKLRHSDHRFEMTRTEFQEFITKHADTYGYEVTFKGIGDTHEEYGQPTQMAILKKKGKEEN